MTARNFLQMLRTSCILLVFRAISCAWSFVGGKGVSIVLDDEQALGRAEILPGSAVCHRAGVEYRVYILVS